MVGIASHLAFCANAGGARMRPIPANKALKRPAQRGDGDMLGSSLPLRAVVPIQPRHGSTGRIRAGWTRTVQSMGAPLNPVRAGEKEVSGILGGTPGQRSLSPGWGGASRSLVRLNRLSDAAPGDAAHQKKEATALPSPLVSKIERDQDSPPRPTRPRPGGAKFPAGADAPDHGGLVVVAAEADAVAAAAAEADADAAGEHDRNGRIEPVGQGDAETARALGARAVEGPAGPARSGRHGRRGERRRRRDAAERLVA